LRDDELVLRFGGEGGVRLERTAAPATQ